MTILASYINKKWIVELVSISVKDPESTIRGPEYMIKITHVMGGGTYTRIIDTKDEANDAYLALLVDLKANEEKVYELRRRKEDYVRSAERDYEQPERE